MWAQDAVIVQLPTANISGGQWQRYFFWLNSGRFFFFFIIPQLDLWGSPFWVRFLRMWPFLNPTSEVVTFHLLWMVHAGYVFVASIHPSRTWTSGSFESVWWKAYVHRLDLGLYSHPKEFWGNGVRTHVSSKGKIPSPRKDSPQRRIEPTTLHQAGQWA